MIGSTKDWNSKQKLINSMVFFGTLIVSHLGHLEDDHRSWPTYKPILHSPEVFVHLAAVFFPR